MSSIKKLNLQKLESFEMLGDHVMGCLPKQLSPFFLIKNIEIPL